MADEKKPVAKKAPAKKPAVKKAAPTQKADAKPVKIATKKPAAQKALTKGLKVTQIASGIGRGEKQNATLRGLGLGKLNRSRILPDTPATRGMVNKISHLVTMEKIG